MVSDKIGRPPGELGVSKSVDSGTLSFGAMTLLLSDRKGIRPVKILVVGLSVVMI